MKDYIILTAVIGTLLIVAAALDSHIKLELEKIKIETRQDSAFKHMLFERKVKSDSLDKIIRKL